MISLIAKYEVKRDKLERVKHAIVEFVNSVKENEPDTLFYVAFQMPDKLSFIHFMSFKDESAKRYHENTSHVGKFVEILYPNCDKQPEFNQVDLIKSSRM